MLVDAEKSPTEGTKEDGRRWEASQLLTLHTPQSCVD